MEWHNGSWCICLNRLLLALGVPAPKDASAPAVQHQAWVYRGGLSRTCKVQLPCSLVDCIMCLSGTCVSTLAFLPLGIAAVRHDLISRGVNACVWVLLLPALPCPLQHATRCKGQLTEGLTLVGVSV